MLQHMDNFAIFGVGGQAFMTNGIYAGVSGCALIADPDVSTPGLAMQVTDLANFYQGARFILPTAETTVGFGWRWWVDAIPTNAADRPAITLRDPSNTSILTVNMNALGGLTVRQGNVSSATVLGSTTGPVLSANGWYHIEVKAVMHATLGTVEIRVEGVTVLLLENLVLDTTVQNIYWGMFSANGPVNHCYFKDLVVWDGSGTYNTDFLGSVLVTSLNPVSDVALNWTPSTGATGYEILDNRGPNDAQYISAPNPPPAAYVCTLSDLPLDVTSVKGVMTIVRAAKSDGGDASLQVSIISDAVTGDGADRPITVAQTYWRDIFEEDPATTAPFLPSAVNALDMQIDRTT